MITVNSSASRPQRATARALCLVHEHPSDCNSSIHLSPSETAVLRSFLPFPAQVFADPNITHRKRSNFYVIDEGETEEGEYGFWVFDEETGEEGFTGLYTENEFWVLSAKGSYSKRRIYGRSFKKGRPKGYGKKGGKKSRPGFRSRSKGKGFAAWEDDQQDTAFWGKGKGKGKGKKGQERNDERKGFFQRNAFMERKRKRWCEEQRRNQSIFVTTSTS